MEAWQAQSLIRGVGVVVRQAETGQDDPHGEEVLEFANDTLRATAPPVDRPDAKALFEGSSYGLDMRATVVDHCQPKRTEGAEGQPDGGHGLGQMTSSCFPDWIRV